MESHSDKLKNRRSFLGILSILFLLFVISGNSILYTFIGFTKTDSPIFIFSRALYWVSIILLWFYARKIEKHSLLLWEERKYKLSHYIISVVGLFVAIILAMMLIRLVLNLIGLDESNTKLQQIISLFRGNIFLVFFTAFTAGVTEELIFRGYIQPRLEIILNNHHLAIIISSLFFGLLHFKYGTVINVLGPFVIGIIFSYYYWKYRNIKVLILFHTLWDLLSIFIHLKLFNQVN